MLSGVRTPVGRYMGALKDVPAFDLGALVLSEAVKRAGVDPGQVDEVILGPLGHRLCDGRGGGQERAHRRGLSRGQPPADRLSRRRGRGRSQSRGRGAPRFPEIRPRAAILRAPGLHLPALSARARSQMEDALFSCPKTMRWPSAVVTTISRIP